MGIVNPMRERIRQTLSRHPRMTAKKVVAVVGAGCTLQNVYEARTKIRRDAKRLEAELTPRTKLRKIGDVEKAVVIHNRNPVNVPTEIQMQVGISHEQTLVLKITNGKGMIGTLTISQTGLKFVQANSKKRSDQEIPFAVLQSLAACIGRTYNPTKGDQL